MNISADDLFFISMAAKHLGMHPQTLRKYERLGLVRPSRRFGSVRVYTHDELERLRTIKYLVDELGINLAGVQRLLTVADIVDRLRPLAEARAPASQQARRRMLKELDLLSELLGR